MTSKKAFYIHLEKIYVSLLTELLTEIKNTNLKSIESVFYCEKFFFAYFFFFFYTSPTFGFHIQERFYIICNYFIAVFSSLERY